MKRLLVNTSVLSAWLRHKSLWKHCNACRLHESRSNVCLVRGVLPADIVFIGEGPGDSEDCFGYPFVGPAGKLLDEAIAEAGGNDIRLAMTNAVGCYPTTDGKGRQPAKDEIKACHPRLVDIVRIANPKLLIGVGRIGENACKKLNSHPFETIIHPSAILRKEDGPATLDYQRTVKTLQLAFRKIVQ